MPSTQTNILSQNSDVSIPYEKLQSKMNNVITWNRITLQKHRTQNHRFYFFFSVDFIISQWLDGYIACSSSFTSMLVQSINLCSRLCDSAIDVNQLEWLLWGKNWSGRWKKRHCQLCLYSHHVYCIERHSWMVWET